MREYGPRFGITGKIVEKEVFGKSPETSTETREASGHEEYLSFRVAMLEIKKDQDSPESKIDPSDPDKEFANDLHASIAEEMTPEDYERLRFYTAIDTVLDRFHGVDGFMEFDLDGGETIVITLDVTTNPNKLDYKADVIILIPSEGVDRKVDPEEYEEALQKAIQDVLGMLKSKIQGRRTATYAK